MTTILAHFSHHPRITASLPRDAPPLASPPGLPRDDTQPSEIAGDIQRLVTMDTAAALGLAARRQVVGR